jgi:Beta-propeller repeat
MRGRFSSVLSRCLSAFRRCWLRHTWLSRLPLLERSHAWSARPHRRRAARCKRPAQVYPTLETLETRWTPDDLLGTVHAPLMVGGLALMPVGVVTPAGVLAKGWPSGIAPPDLTAANADLRLAQTGERDRLSDDDVASFFSAWSQASLGARTGHGDGEQEASSDAGHAGAASGGDADRRFPTAGRTEDGLGEGLDSLAGSKAASRWHPPGSDPSSSANAKANGGGGSGPGGSSTHNNGGGGSGGGGGGLNLNLPGLAALSQMLPNGNPAFASSAGTTSGTTTAPSQAAPTATPAVTSSQANVSTDSSTDPISANTAAFSTLAQNYGNTPVAYVPNVGQTDPSVNFLAQGAGFGLFLTPTGATFNMPVPSQNSTSQTPPTPGQPAASPQFDAFTMQLTGANANSTILAQNQLPSTSNYFLGNDSSQWYTDVPNYGSVQYNNIYPGVNLVYSSVNTNQFEYSFVVQPGASVSEIQQTWQGVTSASIDNNGNLILQTPGGPVVQEAPTVYQTDASGNQVPVSVTQVVTNGNQTSFQVGAYDASKPLVIDPSIAYSTYLGGSNADYGYGIAVDGSGNAYVTGYTTSTNFPTQSGLQSSNEAESNAFITKFNSTGGLIYSTYLGGSGGTFGEGIAVDTAGNAYVTGETGSDFPTTVGALQGTISIDSTAAFVSKLNATGDALLASTYFGGGPIRSSRGMASPWTPATMLSSPVIQTARSPAAVAMSSSPSSAGAEARTTLSLPNSIRT